VQAGPHCINNEIDTSTKFCCKLPKEVVGSLTDESEEGWASQGLEDVPNLETAARKYDKGERVGAANEIIGFVVSNGPMAGADNPLAEDILLQTLGGRL